MFTKTTVVTHNGRFHADDVFAIATLMLAKGDLKVIRTRDESLFVTADIVLDVGGVYDEAAERFDHHQVGGAGARANGLPYAAFGLVWKKYGPVLAGVAAAARIDASLVQALDAGDNGVDLYTNLREDVAPVTFQRIVNAYNPTWKESDGILDAHFLKVVEIAKGMLEREIVKAKDYLEAEAAILKTYEATEDKRLIIFDDRYPAEEILISKSEPLFCVRPDMQNNTWKVGAIPIKFGTFEARKMFPESWAGKRDAELATITGVVDATFCHNKRFLAVAKSKEGAIALANLALAQ